MRSRVVTFFVAFILWMLLSFSFEWQHFSMGILIALIVALMMGDMFTEFPGKWISLRRYGWFVIFIFVFIWECIKANIDVAMRVLNPKLPINPGIVKIKTTLKTETALTFLANFITLTPGTFSVDIDRDSGYLYIHWIDVKTCDSKEAYKIIAEKFENILREVFE